MSEGTRITRPRKSVLWNFFSVVEDGTAECDMCQHRLSYKSTTNNLRKHIQRKHPSIEIEIVTSKNTTANQGKRLRLKDDAFIDVYDATQAYTAPKPDDLTAIVNSLNSSIEESMPSPVPVISIPEPKSPAPPKLSQPIRLKSGKFNTKIMHLFIKDFQPYRMIEDVGFQGVVTFLNPSYQLPNKQFISKYAIPELYRKCLVTSRETIKEGDVFCITLDMWTSVNSDSFLSVTAHFVNEEYQPRTLLLDCSTITFDRTSDNFAYEIKRIVSDWGIEEKIQFVVSENDHHIQNAITDILCYEHFCCFAETLSTVVREAIGSHDVYKILEKISSLVTYFKSNSQLYEKLMSCQKDAGETSVGLKQVSDMRCFRSIYLMLERFMKAEVTIKNVLEVIDDDIAVLTEDEWKITSQLCQVLKPFESVIVTISSHVYCPASMVIPVVNGLRSVCENLMKKSFNKAVEKAVADVKEAITTNWGNIESSATLSVCTFLDPRFKILAFSSKEMADHTRNVVLSALTSTTDDKTNSNQLDESVEEEMTVWHVFDQAVAGNQQPKPDNSSSNKEDDLSVWSTFDNTVAQSKPKVTPTSQAASEIRRYLDAELVPRKENPLEWWKEHRQQYPQLSELARSQLCAVSMSVPCSRVFTKSGMLLTERRNKLSERNTKMLVFLNTNL